MKNYINLFLSKKINYEVENSNTFINHTIDNNERIFKRETRQLDNARFNIILFKLKYPKKIDNIINSNEIMEYHYDSTLILEILDKDENKLYTFYDLLYSTCNTLNDANNNYDKLYSIIHASDNEEDIINTIINAQN